ncbi:MAG: MoaD/ThiS family protein [Anaerolineales bacterium]|nr:MAG: MoaD/ThiS family protein [Anaerolineales bacterium]
MPTLRIPTHLRSHTEEQREVRVSGDTVAKILADFATRYPAVRPHVFDENGELRPFVNLFLNDEDVRFLQGTETHVNEDDRLMLLSTVAGG